MSVKINRLELENVKRVKAVRLEPSENGLTVIGGKNRQGKTSILDAIAWALGGNEFKPSKAEREGSVLPPNLKITLSNGLIVERKGKRSALKVTDPSGKKAGQRLLDSFVEKLALNLPKFMNASASEKAETLLKIIGAADELAQLERDEKEKFSERTAIGRIADQKTKHAKEMAYYDGVPDKPVSASDLIKEQQEILARNGENRKKRERLQQLKDSEKLLSAEIEQAKTRLKELEEKHRTVNSDIMTAMKAAEDLKDESTEELETSIQSIEETNRKIRANLEKEAAEDEAEEYRKQYKKLTEEIADIRGKKTDLLQNADLPLPELSVEDGEITYKGERWDCMSGAEQMKTATAIIRKLNPECGFVLLDRLEQMDTETMKEFGAWLESEGLQAIATRVSTGDECEIIIEDGYVQEEKVKAPEPEKKLADWNNW